MSGHILLVDDEPGLREAVQAYLEDSGFAVQVASNARDAWQLLEQTTPDLVISDIMMPQVSGYEFLKQMRGDVRFLNLPVVFLTAKGMTKDRIDGYNAGCDAYLSKPFDPDELVAIAENLIARRAMQSVTANSNTSELTDLAGQLAEIKALLKQMFFCANHYSLSFWLYTDNIKRLFKPATQTFALTTREIYYAIVLADNLAIYIYNFTRI
jgi:DNA-binding response OmpR family regulator